MLCRRQEAPAWTAVAEPLDELAVGWRKVVVGQSCGLDPLHGLLFAGGDSAGFQAAVEEVQDDRAVRIFPAHGLDEVTDDKAAAQLFLQLASQADRRGLAGLELATGELPEPGQMGAPPAPGDQVASRRIADETDSDLDHQRHAQPRRGS